MLPAEHCCGYKISLFSCGVHLPPPPLFLLAVVMLWDLVPTVNMGALLLNAPQQSPVWAEFVVEFGGILASIHNISFCVFLFFIF